MATRDKRPTEYGGEPGLVQRGTDGFTHIPTPSEEARLMRATEPTDPTDTADGARVRELRSEGRA